MDFNHTPERRMLSDTLQRYVQDKYNTDARAEAAASAVGYRPDVWRELADLGIIGALFSEDTGGFGGVGCCLSLFLTAPFWRVVRLPIVEAPNKSNGLKAS